MMEKKITIVVPEEFVADLEELVREKECSEEEIILNGLKRRIAGSRIRSLADLKAADPRDLGIDPDEYVSD